MKRDPDLFWLERAAAGAREVLADYRRPTQLYPIDTESSPEEKAYLLAQFQAHCVIPEWLRACQNCSGSGPLEGRLCKVCAERKRERDEDSDLEERERKRFLHSTSF